MDLDQYYCYLDVNSLLLNEFFPDINWRRMTGLKTISLIICYPVLKELEKQRQFNPAKEQKEKAGRLIEYFSSMIDGGLVTLVKEGVVLEFLKIRLNIDWEKEGLNPDHLDDQIIAYVLSNKRENKRIITADPGLKLSAKMMGIDCITLFDRGEVEVPERIIIKPPKIKPPKIRIPKVKPPKILKPQKEEPPEIIQPVEEKIERIPELVFRVFAKDSFSKELSLKLLNLPSFELQTIEDVISNIKREILHVKDRLSIVTVKLNEKISFKYNYTEYEDLIHATTLKSINYLRRYYNYLEKWSKTNHLKIALLNKGGARASKIDFTITFPGYVRILEEKRIETFLPLSLQNKELEACANVLMTNPIYKKIIQKFDREKDRLLSHLNISEEPSEKEKAQDTDPNVIQNVKITDSKISASIENLEQDDHISLDILFELVKTNVKSFPVKCTIAAAGLKKDVEDEITVVVKKIQ